MRAGRVPCRPHAPLRAHSLLSCHTTFVALLVPLLWWQTTTDLRWGGAGRARPHPANLGQAGVTPSRPLGHRSWVLQAERCMLLPLGGRWGLGTGVGGVVQGGWALGEAGAAVGSKAQGLGRLAAGE